MKYRYLLSLFTGLFFICSHDASAQLDTDNIFLQGRYLEAVVAPNGSWGNTVNVLPGYHTRTGATNLYADPVSGHTPGGFGTDFAYDAGHDGWAVGTIPWYGNYFLYGLPFNGWQIQINGVRSDAFYNNSGYYNAAGGTLAGTVASYSNPPGSLIGVWQGSAGPGSGLQIRQTNSLDTNASWLVVTTTFINTTGSAMPGVYYEATADPDNDASVGGVTNTTNTIPYQNDFRHRVQVNAVPGTGSHPDAFSGLTTKDCRAEALIYSTWPPPTTSTNNLDLVYSQTATGLGTTNYALGVPSPNADNAYGLIFNIGTIAAGDSATISYAWIFSNSNAVDSAYPEPQIYTLGVAHDSVDTVSNCFVSGSTFNVNILNGTTREWAYSDWTWAPSTGLAFTTGTSNVVDFSLLSGSTTYTITGTNTKLGNCASKTFLLTANFNTTSITGPTTLCPGVNVNLSDVTGGGGWTSSNASVATITSGGVLHGVSAGTTIISYTLASFCYATQIDTVTSGASPISGTTSVCTGSSTILTDVSGTGTWTSSNTGVATVGLSTGTVNGVAAGTTTITFVVTASGCSATTTVTVNLTPADIGGGSAVCVGSTTLFTDGTPSGGWVSSNSGVATVSGGTVGGVAQGTATITYSLGTGCQKTKTIAVNPVPLDISGPGAVCVGSTILLTDGTPSGGWVSSNSGVATVIGGTVGGVAAGTAIISYTLGTGCQKTKTITVNPLPNPIGGTLTVCAGSTTLLTDGTPSGGWASGNTGVATVSGGTVGGVTQGTAIITYDIIATGCMATAIVTVNATPAPITGSSNVCVGSTTLLGETSSGGGWSSSNTGVATVTGGGLVTGVAAGTTTITYAFVSGCNQTFVVTVNLAPSPITGTMSVCIGAVTSLNDGTSGGTWASSTGAVATVDGTGHVSGVSAGTTTITYSLGATCIVTAVVTVNPNPASINPSGAVSVCMGSTTLLTDGTPSGGWSSSSSSIATVVGGTVTGVAAGTVTISYTLGTGCFSTKVVTVNLTPVPISPAGAAVCAGSNLLFSDTSPGGAWSSSNTGVATIGAVSATAGGVALGTTTISYIIGTCYATTTLSVNNVPAAITPAGAVSVCAGSTTILGDVTPGGGWSSSNAGIATVIGGTVTGVAAGTVTISYALGTGCQSIKVVTVNLTPVAISPGPSAVCVGSTVSLSDGTGGGAWSSSNAGVATVGGTGISGGVAAGSATISYTIGTCYATATMSVNANPAAITPAGAVSVCAGATTVLGDVTPAGAWSSNNTGIATVIGGTITGVAAGTVTISYTLGTGCSSVKTITVNIAPGAISPSSTPLCTGATLSFSDGVGGGAWSSSNVGVATIGGTGIAGGVASGSATISYAIGTCLATATVTVSPLPGAGSITGAASVCMGSSSSYTDGAGGGVWSSSNIAVATITATGTLNGVSAGTTTISYSVTNSCGTVVATQVVTIVPTGAGSITGPTTICAGTFVVLTDGVSGGVWSVSNSAATITSGGLLTGVSPGADTITYSVTNVCGTSTTTKTITIGAFLTAGSITGAGSVCAGSTTTLTDATGLGVWSSSNTGVATVTSGGVVTGVSAGTTMISYTVTASCGSVSATHAVVVHPLPNAGGISGTAIICAGMTSPYTDAAGGGVWSCTNSNASINSAGLLTGVTPGTDTIRYTVTNVCGTAVASKTITIGAFLTAGTISGTGTVCPGATVTLTDPATGGAWSSGTTAIATVGTSGTVTGVSAGGVTISYTVTSACGTVYATKTITVNPLPNAGVISGPGNLCIGIGSTYTDAAGGGAWSMAGSSATITGGGVATPVSTGTNTVSYSVTNSCGTAIATQTITINAFPSAGTISGPGSVCVGGTPITLTDGVAGGVWGSSNTNATLSGGVTVTGVTAGSDTILYTVSNLCGVAVATYPVIINPAPDAGAIVGPTTLCAGTFTIYTDASSGGAWNTSNPNATITSAGVLTALMTGLDTVSYTVTNSCGTATATMPISIGTSVTAGTISGPASVCAGSSITMSESATGGIWSSGSTGIAVIGSITGVVTGLGSGVAVITYTISGSCGSGSTTATITVNSSPSVGTISGPSVVCTGSTVTFTDGPAGGVWASSNSSATISSAGIAVGITPGTDTIFYTVTNACGTTTTSKIISVMIAPSTVPIAGPGSVCVGSAISLTDGSPGGIWTSSSPALATVGSVSGVVSGVMAGTAIIFYSIPSSCGTSITSVTVTVSPLPNPGAITGPSSVCVGSLIVLSDATTGGVWSATSGNTSITTSGIVTGLTPGSDVINYTVSNSCGTTSASKVISVNTFPTVGGISGPASVCQGSSITLTDAVAGGIWSSLSTSLATVNPATGVVIGTSPGSDIISYTITNACGTVGTAASLVINPLPNPGAISGPDSVCLGSAITLIDPASAGIWSSGNANASVTAGVVSGLIVGTDPISYSVTNLCGTLSAVKIVTVVSFPTIGPISGSTAVCNGSATSLTDPVAGGVWASSNSNATVNSAGSVTGAAVGSATISYIITNACGTINATQSMTINPIPAIAPISGPTSQCMGTTITLTDATAGGTWSSSNAAIASVSTVGIVNGVSTGNAVITYTVINSFGCGTGMIAFDTVGAVAVVPSITGSTNVCVGVSTPLSDAMTGGAWSSSNTAVATADAAGNITGVTAGTASIIYTVLTPCGMASVSRVETVNPAPVVAAIAGATHECNGATTALSDATGGGVWSSSDATIALVGSATGVVTSVSAGVVNINYTVTNSFGCNGTATVADTVIAIPAVAAITGTANECAGTTTTLSDATAGGVWSSGSTAIATVNAAGVVGGVTPGSTTIMYSVTVSGCTGSAAVADIVSVNPVAGVISGTMDVCVGSTTTLTDASAGGIWTSAASGTAVVGGSTGVVTGVAAGNVNIYYTVSNACGSVTDTAVVTVNAIPSAGAIMAPYNTICMGSSMTLTDGATGGVWSSSDGMIATVSSTGVVTALSVGTATIVYTVTSGTCSNSASVNLTVSAALPSAAITPGGSITLCHGNPVTLNIVSGTGITYQWLYNGAVIAGATNSIYTTYTSGTFNAIVSNGICNETLAGTLVVSPPSPVVTFTAPDMLVTGSYASYQWFLNGLVIPGATSSVYHYTTGGNYKVAVADANGCQDTSAEYVVTSNNGGTGVTIANVANNIRIYPNPATSVLHIDAPVAVRVAVMSIDGKVLIRQNNADVIDVSRLTGGLYLVMIYDQDGLLIKTAKFTKTE